MKLTLNEYRNRTFKGETFKEPLYDKHFEACVFEDCIFDWGHLDSCYLEKCRFVNCKFRFHIFVNCNIYHVVFENTEFTKVEFRKSDCYFVEMNNVDIYYLEFYLTYLDGFNIKRGNIKRIELNNSVCYNNKFEPDASLSMFIRYSQMFNSTIGGGVKFIRIHESDIGDDCIGKNKHKIYCSMHCPEEGSFVGFKKAENNVIVKLQILEDARRSSAFGKQCRCSKAKVLGFYDLNHEPLNITETRSRYDRNFAYKLGEVVEASYFEDNRFYECAAGIHFFLTFEDAANYG